MNFKLFLLLSFIIIFPVHAENKKKTLNDNLPHYFKLEKIKANNDLKIYKKLCNLSTGTNFISTKLALYDYERSNNGDYTPGDMFSNKQYSDLSIKIEWDDKKSMCLVRGSIKGIVNGTSRSYNGKCVADQIQFDDTEKSYTIVMCQGFNYE